MSEGEGYRTRGVIRSNHYTFSWYTSAPANLHDPPSDFSEGLVLRLD